jgi:hypothetical protein
MHRDVVLEDSPTPRTNQTKKPLTYLSPPKTFRVHFQPSPFLSHCSQDCFCCVFISTRPMRAPDKRDLTALDTQPSRMITGCRLFSALVSYLYSETRVTREKHVLCTIVFHNPRFVRNSRATLSGSRVAALRCGLKIPIVCKHV